MYNSTMNDLQRQIQTQLMDSGASLVGWADVTDLPESARDSFKQAISIALALNPAIVHQIQSGPTLDYFQEYIRLNDRLWDLSRQAAQILESHGIRARTMRATAEAGQFDAKALSVPLPHKAAALRAGLGWIGRSNLLVTRQYGPAVRLVTVLCDGGFETAQPITESSCGDCNRCMEHCPARAITGRLWKAGMTREELYDAKACYHAAKESSSRIGIQATICGICIHVCPWSQRYLAGHNPKESHG
jgi:epoxyqueuosine reductase